jgi:hypothetical protein
MKSALWPLPHQCILISALVSCSPPFESDTSERNKNKAPIVPIRDVGSASNSQDDSKLSQKLKGKWGWLERQNTSTNAPTAEQNEAKNFSLQCTGFFDENFRFITSPSCNASCSEILVKIWLTNETNLAANCTGSEEVATAKGEKLRRITFDRSSGDLKDLSGLRVSATARASKSSAVRAIELRWQSAQNGFLKALSLSTVCEVFGPLESSAFGSHSCSLGQKNASHLFYATEENAWLGISASAPDDNSTNSVLVAQDLKELTL